MVNIFLSCSSKDHDYIKTVIDNLTNLPDKYKLIYFLQPYNTDTPMQYILERLSQADLFIVFISNSSLDSIFVQYELKEAIRLYKIGRIKGICTIIIDESIRAESDYRIPRVILNNNVFYSNEAEKAIRIAKEFMFTN